MQFEMFAKVRFSSPIRIALTDISPGGYIIKSKHRRYNFDFCRYDLAVDENDPHNLYIHGYSSAEWFCASDNTITPRVLLNIKRFSEFYIFICEEALGANLKPMRLLSCQFYIPDRDAVVNLSRKICKKSHITTG